MITNSSCKQYYLTFAIVLILLINSCLNTSYITEEKSGIVKYLDTENYLKRKSFISKINSKSYSIDQNNQMYFLYKIPENNNIKIKLTQCLQCVEYKADEYVIKEVYRDTSHIDDERKAALCMPHPYSLLLYSVNISLKTLIIPFEILIGKSNFKDIPYEIGQIIIVPYGMKKIKTIDIKNKNHIKTGKAKWKNFAWKNGKINVIVNNKTYMFTADSEGIAIINIIDLLKKIDINSEQLSINIISDNEGTKDSKKIVLNDYILSKLEPKLADMSYGTSLLAPFIEADLELKYSQKFSLNNGDNDILIIKVINSGKGIAYQFKAIIRSDNKIFDGKELLIGRLNSGQTKSVRFPFQIPKDNKQSNIKLIISFFETNGYIPSKIFKIINIEVNKESSKN